MDTPLWYKVSQKELGFKEFLDRYNDNLFTEKDTLPIFILSAMTDNEPYVTKMHVLHHFVQGNNLSERALRYFYLYWILTGSYGNDYILSDVLEGGQMSKIKLQFPPEFDSEYIMDWIAVIFRSFFEVGPIAQDISDNRLNMEQLLETLGFAERLVNERFIIPKRTVARLYRLMQAHLLLLEVKQFLRGDVFPRVLYPYRDDPKFIKSVVYQFWPCVLKTLHDHRAFNQWEINLISEAHRKLYEMGNVDFLFTYIDLFIKTFGESNVLSHQLIEYLKPSRENDRLRTEQFLRKHNPVELQRFLPQFLPISNTQVELFIKEVEHKGLEEAIKPFILNVKSYLERQIQKANAELFNNTFFYTQTSIYLYPPTEYIFFPSGKNYFAFLTSELHHLNKDRKNPYTREDLPDYLFTSFLLPQTNRSLEEIWSEVLRREVILTSVLE